MSKFISVCRERDLPGRSRTMTGLKRVDKSKGRCIIRSRSMFDKGQTRAYEDLFMYLFIYYYSLHAEAASGSFEYNGTYSQIVNLTHKLSS